VTQQNNKENLTSIFGYHFAKKSFSKIWIQLDLQIVFNLVEFFILLL